MKPETDIPVITGPDSFDIEAVDESKYLENFIKVCGPRCKDAVDMIVQAHLTLEDTNPFDDLAVAISVSGHLVGYLPRAMAREFRQALCDGDLMEYNVFACNAHIRGGWYRSHDDQGHYGIRLDLPQDEKSLIPEEIRLESDANPRIPIYRHAAVADRQIDELIGIVKGVMADGTVTHGEVEFLLRWMESNRHSATLWPAKALYPRLAKVVAKGFMNLHEESEMLDLLMNTVGGNNAPLNGFASNSTTLPLTQLIEPLSFEGRAFCFTGTFHSGTRDWCHTQTASRGGRNAGNITKKLDYLVIGDIGNEAWAHSTHGRKIEKAIEYNSAGCRIAIVSEEHWYAHL